MQRAILLILSVCMNMALVGCEKSDADRLRDLKGYVESSVFPKLQARQAGRTEKLVEADALKTDSTINPVVYRVVIQETLKGFDTGPRWQLDFVPDGNGGWKLLKGINQHGGADETEFLHSIKIN